uniref:Uncharacterized protein n=1 Tax=Hyaloperonospora arabidopsidis (strain Emoy2) TaxID=559515 RepID=M4BNW4_HYAAE
MSGFTSTTNSLQILNRAEGKAPYQTSASHAMPRSQMWTLGYTPGRWFVMSILDLPNLTSPDVFVVQERVAIVGSTMSSCLLFAHLNNSDPLKWTPSLYGELDLPTAHVCRGIRFTENSLYVDVATTEKRKRISFFQAAASLEPQPVYLSKFRVPQYALSKVALGPTSKLLNVTAFAGNDTPSSFGDDNCDTSTHTDLPELIVAKMTAMQT